MENLLPKVTIDTIEQRAKTLIDTMCSDKVSGDAIESELKTIQEENPELFKLIRYYSTITMTMYGELSGALCQTYLITMYHLLRLQAESDRMEKEIKL